MLATDAGVVVLWNDGAGGFAARSVIPFDHPASDVLPVDLDGDGHRDVVAAMPGGYGLDYAVAPALWAPAPE